MTVSPNPRILVLPRPNLLRQLLGADGERRLSALGRVAIFEEDRSLSSAELAAQIAGFDVVLTGWGTPAFTDEVLASATELKLIAHTAGSIKYMLPPPVFERGIAVTHAAPVIAVAVAEWTLLMVMTMLQRPHLHDRNLRAGVWDKGAVPMRQELAGRRVSLVGASYTGRSFAALLRAVGAEVWIYDPYLTEADAADLGVGKVTLDHLLSACPIVSLHAPITPETHHMIGARELGLLADGALFVNAARAWLVDETALLAELRSGRIDAALDVFDNEPLPVDNPFRELENVLLTPHMAGHSLQSRRRQGSHMIAEVERFLAGEPLHFEVRQEHLMTMA